MAELLRDTTLNTGKGGGGVGGGSSDHLQPAEHWEGWWGGEGVGPSEQLHSDAMQQRTVSR